jgi:hypothetical protein
MEIVYERPPVWDRATSELGADEDTIFTYGDTMYVPSGRQPDAALIAHEEVHSLQQQSEVTPTPAIWWEAYFGSNDFRFSQEAPAYKKQYDVFCITHKDRNERARYLAYITNSITGKLYGHLPGRDIRKLILGQ